MGSSSYWLLSADYQVARGPDFADLGTGIVAAPDALGWHNAVTFQTAGRRSTARASTGGVVMACARWSSKGYWGVDLGAGLSPTRLAADVHESCRDGCDGNGWDLDD